MGAIAVTPHIGSSHISIIDLYPGLYCPFLLFHKALGSVVIRQSKGRFTLDANLCIIFICTSAISAVHKNTPFSHYFLPLEFTLYQFFRRMSTSYDLLGRKMLRPFGLKPFLHSVKIFPQIQGTCFAYPRLSSIGP